MCPTDSTHQPHNSMTESSRTRSDSLEASSSQQERKRPRLDSGHNDALRSEEALTDSNFPGIAQAPDSPVKEVTGSTYPTNSSSPSPSTMEPSSNGPLSKVTINTRSATNNVSDGANSSTDQSEGTSTGQKSPVATSTTPMESASSPNTGGLPPETITIRSSPSQSPEIQIAVVEDIDQDPAETNWTPVTRLNNSVLLQEQATPQYVGRTFPYAQRTPTGYTHEVLTEMGKTFVQGSLVILVNSLYTDLGPRWGERWTHFY